MNTKKYSILILAVMLLSACESVLDLDTEDANDDYCISTAITAGEPISVFVSRTMSSYDYQSDDISTYTYEQSWRRSLFAWLRGYTTADGMVKDADIVLTINDKIFPLHYDESIYGYTCDYIPAENDRITMKMIASDKIITSECNVPTSAKLQISDIQRIYQLDAGQNITSTTPPGLVQDENAIDSVMTFRIKIVPNDATVGYYRLMVRSVGYNDECDGYIVSDIFSSDDDIFYDENIQSAFCTWQANFSNIFSLTGERGDIAITSRIRKARNKFILVELQTLTRDLYNYLKVIENFRQSVDDEFSNPVCLKTNISEGFGVFGAVACDSKIISVE